MAKFKGANSNKENKPQDNQNSTEEQGNHYINRDRTTTERKSNPNQKKPTPKGVKLNSDKLKSIFKNKKVVASVVTLGVLLGGFGIYKGFFAPDEGKVKFEEGQKIDNQFGKTSDEVDDNKDSKKSKDDSSYFKENQVYTPVYMPMNEENYRIGAFTYLDPNLKKLTSTSNPGTPFSNAVKVGSTQLYGFAAFKNEATNKWVRIPGIEPIPEMEEKYESYGGTDVNTAKADIEKRKAKADKLYDEAVKKNTKPILDMGNIEDEKAKDPNVAIELVSKQIEDNAEEFVTPLKFYTQDTFNLELTAEEVQNTKEDRVYNYLNERFFGLVRKDSIDKLNKINQKLAKEMYNNYGLDLLHDVYVFNDKTYIVIDGVAYKYNNVVLDLYDNPEGKSDNRVNLLGNNNTQPTGKNYKTSIMVEKDKSEPVETAND